MTAYNMNCPPAECGPCGTLPSGFVRLRYFYGKRLAVADFLDEQRYHSGKLRFHNQRMHGSGVLCGLRADLFSTDPADATILRVHRGAAIDGCGREIIVGWDQCIDVDAWLGRKLQSTPDFLTTNDPQNTNQLQLCVVLRYRECPASPEAAPRDACSCDASGCDYGRIREEFELDLIAKPTAPLLPAIFPPRDQLVAALSTAPGVPAIVDHIAALATAGCPTPDPEGWLELACFTVTLKDPASATDRKHVVSIANIQPAESILYETALLQELLLRDLAATLEGGSLADGPQVASITLDAADPPTYLQVNFTTPVLGSTFATTPFALQPFTAASGWSSPLSLSFTIDPNGMFIQIAPPPSTLVDGSIFRLVSLAPVETPVVDKNMRPLLPLRFSFHLAIAKDSTTTPPTYSIAAPPITP